MINKRKPTPTPPRVLRSVADTVKRAVPERKASPKPPARKSAR